MRTLVILLAGTGCCHGQEPSAANLIEAGHWKRARVLVEHRLQVAPDDPDATFLLSQIRAAFGDRTTPLTLAEKAVRLGPEVARYHRQLAEVQGVMAQHANVFQQAMLARRFRHEIDAAIGLDVRDVQAWRDLLEYYLLAPGIIGGDVKKAQDAATRIAGIDACEGALALARIAEYRKDRQEQSHQLRRAVELGPASYRARIALAETGDAEAEREARAAISIDRGRADAYGALAGCYARRGDWSALDALLAEASQAIPDDPWPYYRAADQLLHDGREATRAERYLHVYLTQEPEGNRPSAAEARRKLARGAAR